MGTPDITRDDLVTADRMVRRFLETGDLPTPSEQWLAERIDAIPVRDVVWAHLAPGSDRAAALAVRLTQDRRDSAAAWFLAGFQAWQDGLWADAKGALAWVDEIDPGYSAARLLASAVEHKVPGAAWKHEPEESVEAVLEAFDAAQSST